MTSINIRWLKDISKSDTDSVGEKAAYLAELYNERLPVPNAFVISSDLFENIIGKHKEQINGLLASVSDFESAVTASNQVKTIISQFTFTDEFKERLLKNYRELEEAERYKGIPAKTLDLISPTRDLPFVAVRASSTKTFPGLFKPVLNAYGIESLTDAIKKVFINIFSPRAILYYHNHKVGTSHFSISIVIQKMVNSKKSGDLFSINPIKNSKDEIYVQSIWGINNSYLDNPSTSIFNKIAKELIEEHLVTQETHITKNAQFGELISEPLPENARHSSVLSKTELSVLCDLTNKIERIMNFPQHIEWSIERDGAKILQTQPITKVLSKPLNVKPAEGDRVITQGVPIVAESSSGNIISNIQNQRDVSDSIIVTDKLDSSTLPLLIKSKGVITNTLGLTSNLTFMCKEFGIPCIVGVGKDSILKDGQKVEINSDGSIISVIEQPTPSDSYNGYYNVPSTPTELETTSVVVQPSSGGMEGLHQQLHQLERYIIELASSEAQKRASGDATEEDFKRSQLLSELEWQVRALRKKIAES